MSSAAYRITNDKNVFAITAAAHTLLLLRNVAAKSWRGNSDDSNEGQRVSSLRPNALLLSCIRPEVSDVLVTSATAWKQNPAKTFIYLLPTVDVAENAHTTTGMFIFRSKRVIALQHKRPLHAR